MSDQLTQEVKKEVRRRSDNFEKFFKNGDAAGLVNDYYVEKPLMSAPDMPILRSRAEITQVFEALVKEFAECKLFQEVVQASGELAYELGYCKIKHKDPSKDDIDARYTIIWRKVPDGWRVESDFFAYGKLV
jgi:ketosteroid isomerase-like protein